MSYSSRRTAVLARPRCAVRWGTRDWHERVGRPRTRRADRGQSRHHSTTWLWGPRVSGPLPITQISVHT